MANIIEYADVFQRELDAQLIEGATSGWMEQNAGQVIYNGGASIKIPRLSTDGLGFYDRAAGFPPGAITFDYETKTMAMDRGREFMVDAMDVDETAFVLTAANIMRTFQELHVIPEVDAYRYATIASGAVAANKTSNYTPAAATILEKLYDDIYAIWDAIGASQPLVICMSTLVAKFLDNSDKIQKQITLTNFAQGDVSMQVKSINGVPIILVPSDRMHSNFLFKSGGVGQTEGGFEPGPTAKGINWLIVPRHAPIAVSKTDNFRIFDPATTQKAHAWKIDYRKYHDLWLPQNRYAGVRVSLLP